MTKPDFSEIVSGLEKDSQNLKDNGQLGNSKIVHAFAKMIEVMGWESSQRDTNNIQIANLTDELKRLGDDLRIYSASADKESRVMRYLTYAVAAVAILQLLIAYGQYRLGEIQVETSRQQTGLEDAIWQYEQMRDDRLEIRDVQWRREDLESQGRLPIY